MWLANSSDAKWIRSSIETTFVAQARGSDGVVNESGTGAAILVARRNSLARFRCICQKINFRCFRNLRHGYAVELRIAGAAMPLTNPMVATASGDEPSGRVRRTRAPVPLPSGVRAADGSLQS